MEEEPGVQLFKRSKRTLKLTKAGACLQEQWLRMMEEIDRLHRQAKNIHEGTFGFIRIGYPGSIAYGFYRN